MKIRKGFVSNSSSSSFVCDVSGHIVCGYDMTAEEAGFYECVNGHEFYEDYLVDKDKFNDYCSMMDESDDDFDPYYIRFELPEQFCPICTMNKIKKGDAITYLLKKSNTTMEKVIEEIKKEFDSYEDLKESLK